MGLKLNLAIEATLPQRLFKSEQIDLEALSNYSFRKCVNVNMAC